MPIPLFLQSPWFSDAVRGVYKATGEATWDSLQLGSDPAPAASEVTLGKSFSLCASAFPPVRCRPDLAVRIERGVTGVAVL